MPTQRTTARGIVNKALTIMGYLPIATDVLYNTGIIDAFGNLNSQLDKYQQQGVTLYDIFQQTLCLVMNKAFMWRRFQITTVAPNALGVGVPDYVINDVIIEGLRANSFFNVTFGAGPGNPLRVIPYQQFMEMYARLDIVPIGTPEFVVPIVEDGSDICRLKLVPTPDQVYTIEGQCRYQVPPVAKGSDLCAFPYRYEHPLVMKLVEVLETRVNEGREGAAKAYADQFIAEMTRDASGADEEIDQQDLGFSLWGGRGDSCRDYNPSTDVVPQYP